MQISIRKISILPLLLMLGGCDSFLDFRMNKHVTDAMESHEFRTGNRVDFVKYHHSVAFKGGANFPSDPQLDKFDAFINGIHLGYGDDVILRGGSPARRTALEIYLKRKAIPIQIRSEPGSSAEFASNTVNVTVDRYVVTPPGCPNWNNFHGNEQRNAPGSNYGCATDAGLGYMVANPRDLVEGQPMGPYLAKPSITAQRRYADDKVDYPKLPSMTNADPEM